MPDPRSQSRFLRDWSGLSLVTKLYAMNCGKRMMQNAKRMMTVIVWMPDGIGVVLIFIEL